MLEVNNYSEVFSVFKQNYKLVPLEVFGKNPYKTLVSTLLSSRTKDEVTLAASKRLFTKASGVKALNRLKTKEIERLIYPVGFYRVKARNLKKLARTVIHKYGGKIPSTQKELMGLPGVGEKTANLVLNRAFNIPAIAVDTHVHTISNLLGWVKTKSPQETLKALTRSLPKKYRRDINRLFVSIGQQYRGRARLIKFLRSKRLLK